MATSLTYLVAIIACFFVASECASKYTCNCNDGTSLSVYDCASVRQEDDGAHPTCDALCVNHRGVASCDGTTCFPGSALVELDSSIFIPMSQLKVGDRVRVSADSFSTVYTFSHKDDTIAHDFVRLATRDGHLRLTAGHLLYVNATKLMAAGHVTVGDLLTTANGTLAPVTAISRETAQGLYNPHTEDGNIVVDGFKTSTYTTAVPPTVAELLLWPVRQLSMLFGVDVLTPLLAQGLSLNFELIKTLPSVLLSFIL